MMGREQVYMTLSVSSTEKRRLTKSNVYLVPFNMALIFFQEALGYL